MYRSGLMNDLDCLPIGMAIVCLVAGWLAGWLAVASMTKTEKLLFIANGWSTADPPTTADDDDYNKFLKPSRHLTSTIITRWPFVNSEFWDSPQTSCKY